MNGNFNGIESNWGVHGHEDVVDARRGIVWKKKLFARSI